ncbi:MAG: Holliday junction resolvase RuvX [Ignavibacteriaceae bacterium]|nr:Holliday junction resolvase RuvX [Ignavibacteriaceae bacterium]
MSNFENNEIHKRVLSIDYGKKRIGIAISDPLKLFATPLVTIKNSINSFNEIKQIVLEKDVELVVVGLPTREDGQKSILFDDISNLKKKIECELQIKVELWDESFSSVAAEEIIYQNVKKSKRRDKALIDKNAAAVILTEYLNSI